MEQARAQIEDREVFVSTKLGGKQLAHQNLYWVLQARDEKETRASLLRVSVKNSRFTCSDAKRLHSAKIPDYSSVPNGDYSVMKCTKSEITLLREPDDIFPNWREVVPRRKANIKLKCASKHTDADHSRVVKALHQDAGLNLQYFSQAAADPCTVFIWNKDNTKPIMIKSRGRLALVMPIRL